MGKALGVLLIAFASGLLIYRFVAPQFLLPGSPPGVKSLPTPVSTAEPPSQPPLPTQPQVSDHAAASPHITTDPSPGIATDPSLPSPRTPEQRTGDDLEAKRAPYYRWLRKHAADRVTDVRPANDDVATLVIYTTVDNPDVVPMLARDVIAPAAFQYGFRHVRFFVPNPPGSVSHYRYDAEANADPDGNWHTFYK